MTQKIIISTDIAETLKSALSKIQYSSIFILTDEVTKKLCLPRISYIEELKNAPVITIKSGDDNKNIETAVSVWKYLSENNANRKSLIINLGGGMITDLGGFTASTFKRGVQYINIPTTLLGAIDAAVGGKTGINFLGFKNEIGVINPAEYVLIDPNFFETLDRKNFLSGFAEMLKHALISSEKDLIDILKFDLEKVDYKKLAPLLARSVAIKENIVEQDPKEQGIRKALNFGHTIGHAFESLSYEKGKPLLHGYAVAYAMICELYLSCKKTGFPKEILQQIRRLIVDNYGMPEISCKDYPRLYEFMTHDKKNETSEINFTLLEAVGDIKINQTASRKEIFEAIDFLF
jgi:3-dehydroquinate synthase